MGFWFIVFYETDKIDESIDKINFQVNFPNKKISKRPWVPTAWKETFIDAKTIQTYTYVTSIPNKTKFISLFSKFLYPKLNDFYSAQKAFEISSLSYNNRKKSCNLYLGFTLVLVPPFHISFWLHLLFKCLQNECW